MESNWEEMPSPYALITMWRVRTPGGWLVMTKDLGRTAGIDLGASTTYVPDVDGTWAPAEQNGPLQQIQRKRRAEHALRKSETTP